MSSLNTESMSSVKRTKTYQGISARLSAPLTELRRAVLSCFLWEKSFYESGNDLADRISNLIPQIETDELMALAVEARHDMNLRHIPLFLAVEMLKTKHKPVVRLLIPQIINRLDDLTELVSIYWRGGKKPLANQLKQGIADALPIFGEYQLAKYQNVGGVKLRDLFNLVHPKPKDKKQERLWKRLMTKGLDAPDTWEVKLSKDGNTKESWEKLLRDKSLGSMALLRNLRNMTETKVDKQLIKVALAKANYDRVLPFRFIAATKYVPQLEPEIESAFMNRLKDYPRLKGKTAVLVDISGSMTWPISERSDMDRIDAGCGLAMIIREIAEDINVYAFHNQFFDIPARRGFALRDAIKSNGTGGTYLGAAINKVQAKNPDLDRIIVFTDEQSHDTVPQPKVDRAYMINISSYKPVVSYGKWISISGFSERVVDFIAMVEDLG